MKRAISLVALLLLASACSQAPAPADSSVITSGAAKWEASFNAGDIDTLVSLYTADARVLPPNSELEIGSDAVRAEFSAMIDAGLAITLSTVEAMVSGDIGHRFGTYTLQTGGETVDVGKYIETWQRGDDGQWRISNDIWNSDLPVAGPDMPMAHMMILHEVDDAEKWQAAWRGADSRHQLFKDNGAAHVHTFQSIDKPNLTGLVIAVSDMDALNAMLSSEEGMAAAAADGVRGDTMIVLNETR